MKWFFGQNKDDSQDYLRISYGDIEEVLEKAGIPDDKVSQVTDSLFERLNNDVKEKSVLTLDEFGSTFNNVVADLYFRATNTIQRAKQLSQFIEQNSEVGSSVKLYASYITYGAADIQLDEYKVIVSGENTDKVSEANKLIATFEDTTKIKRLIYQLAKDLVSFGDAYLEKIRDKDGKLIGLAYIPADSVYVKLNDRGIPVAYYQFIEKPLSAVDDKILLQYEAKRKVIKFEPSEIAHFNDGSVIGFSDSTVSNLIVQCRFMKLLEETLLVHRITRSRRFIVFFLDVAGKTKEQIKSAVRAFTRTIKKMFTLNIEEGEIQRERTIMPSVSDLVIPITKDSATKVQAIPSDPSATKIDDLKFYSNRITQALLTSHIFGSEKTGKEQYIQEAFFRMVRIYQKQMAFVLSDIYKEVLEQEGYKDLRVSVVFPAPDPSVEIKVIDSVVRRMMVVNQLIATTGVVPPNRWIVEYVFKDLTMLEVEQLVNMLLYAEKEQNKAAEGNEYPTVFQQNEETENAPQEEFLAQSTNAFDLANEENKDLFSTNTAYGDFFSHLFELKRTNEAVNEKTTKQSDLVSARLTQSIKLAMDYLKLLQDK